MKSKEMGLMVGCNEEDKSNQPFVDDDDDTGEEDDNVNDD